METAQCPDRLSVIYTAVLYGSLCSPSYRRMCKARSQTLIGLLGLDGFGCLSDSKRAGNIYASGKFGVKLVCITHILLALIPFLFSSIFPDKL